MKSRSTALLWTGAYLLLILSLLTSLSMITAFLLIVPVIVLYNILNTKKFFLHVVPVWLIAFIIHPVYLFLALYFVIPAILMGRCYKRRASALRTIVVGAATILVEMLLLLLIGTMLFQFDLSGYVQDMVNVAVKPMQEMVGNSALAKDFVLTKEYMDSLMNMTVQRIPFALILSSFMLSIIAHAITRPILERMGYTTTRLKPVREWKFPRSLIWYYLLGVVLEFMAFNSESSYLTMISANLVPMLNIFFCIQAMAFFFFIAYHRKWHPVIPFILAVPVFLFPPMAIIGIIDIAFPLRQLMTKSK
ncbi:hypothetical protein PMSD_01110 [Paenibacillus macquariensis subsp. defensor]|nr:hypothetical protein PMSD_01110 [Paenibacillus macquariensis subsp. defensor]